MRLRRTLALLVLSAALGVVLEAPPVASAALAGEPECGVERWDVKTLSDPAADQISFTSKLTTVRALRERPKPQVGKHTPRLAELETKTWRVKAILVDAKLVEDSDIHLVIADPRNEAETMIVEFPDVACAQNASEKALDKMGRARTALIAACGSVPRHFIELDGMATVSGVTFYDKIHGQRGRAPNGIELHPVTFFRSDDCTREP